MKFNLNPLTTLIDAYHITLCKCKGKQTCENYTKAREYIFSLAAKHCEIWLTHMFTNRIISDQFMLSTLITICKESERLFPFIALFENQLEQTNQTKDIPLEKETKRIVVIPTIQQPRSLTPPPRKSGHEESSVKSNQQQINVESTVKRGKQSQLTEQMKREVKMWISNTKVPYPHVCVIENCKRCYHLSRTRKLTECRKYHKGACNALGLFPHITKLHHQEKNVQKYHGHVWPNPLCQLPDLAQQNKRTEISFESGPMSMEVSPSFSKHDQQVTIETEMLNEVEFEGKQRRSQMYHMRPGMPGLQNVFNIAKRHIQRIKSKYGEKAEMPTFATCMYKILFNTDDLENTSLSSCIENAKAMGGKVHTLKSASGRKRPNKRPLSIKQYTKRIQANKENKFS